MVIDTNIENSKLLVAKMKENEGCESSIGKGAVNSHKKIFVLEKFHRQEKGGAVYKPPRNQTFILFTYGENGGKCWIKSIDI